MPKTRRPLAVAAILLSMFMAALEATVVATAMPTVVGDLGGIELYGWVGSVYMVASTITMPIYGKLSDLYGRKPIMFLGIGVFLAGSMASGLAGTMTQLIAFRALQGIGAGGVQPIALTIVGDLFTVQERGKIQGLFGAVWGVAGMAGPLVGGLIVHALSWRWVFYINLPFGLLSAGLLAAFFHEDIAKKNPSIDFLGAGLLSSAILSLLLAVSGVQPLMMVPLTVVSLAGFVWAERRAKEPILPLDLLARPVIAHANLAGGLMGSLMMATVMYVPLFVQAVLGGTPTEAGSAVAPMLVGWPIASAISGRLLTRVGMRPLVRTGAAIACASAWVMVAALRPFAPLFAVRIAMFALGVGMGTANTVLIIAVQQAVSWKHRGVATASTMFFRTIGGALAVGILGAILAHALGPGVPTELVNQLLGPTHGRGIDEALLAPLSSAMAAGLGTIFQVIAGIGTAALVAGLVFPRVEIAAASSASSQSSG
jgi:EmrB/QacA subfamily drug resistance transporter